VTNEIDQWHPIRPLNISWTKIPSPPQPKDDKLYLAIRHELIAHRSLFEAYLYHPHPYIFQLAVCITANFTDTPEETCSTLKLTLEREQNPSRRALLYSAFRTLKVQNKVSFLQEAFSQEIEHLVRLVLAGQIAYELKQACPQGVIDYL